MSVCFLYSVLWSTDSKVVEFVEFVFYNLHWSGKLLFFMKMYLTAYRSFNPNEEPKTPGGSSILNLASLIEIALFRENPKTPHAIYENNKLSRFSFFFDFEWQFSSNKPSIGTKLHQNVFRTIPNFIWAKKENCQCVRDFVAPQTIPSRLLLVCCQVCKPCSFAMSVCLGGLVLFFVLGDWFVFCLLSWGRPARPPFLLGLLSATPAL